MPSAVLDSTVLISAFLVQRGVSNELLRHAREGAFLLYLSEEILDEAQGVLLDEERRHRQRYHYPNEAASNFIEGLPVFARLVSDIPQVTIVIRDPNDDMVIATAQRAQAAYIVTRDKDLLSLQHFEGITMITPEAFIAIVREQKARRSTGDKETGEKA
jgi:putative PIN family toxin of toxin-antitoxin system